MKQNEAQAELNTRVKEAMNEAGGNRFYIDERGGCIAVRDKLRDNPDDNGLHQDTNGVVSYWTGYKEDGEWKISQACKDNAKELRDKLNGYEGATQKPVYTQDMHSHDILPPVGAEFEIAMVISNGANLSKWASAVIKGVSGDQVWIRTGDKEIIKNRGGFRFRPLPQPTERDKAIEELTDLISKAFAHDLSVDSVARMICDNYQRKEQA